MKTAVEQNETSDTRTELWIRMYRKMTTIRMFEEQVNDIYTRALMPGLAHLYLREEAVTVGVCEALRNSDYITSTHRGHGHCVAKGASPDEQTLINSAKKTSRVIVMDQGYERYGVTAEIAAVIAEGAFYNLEAPVKRMGAMHVPIPFSPPLEDATVPIGQVVFEAAKALCGKS